MKLKKQFRLFDIYRFAATGIKDQIKGIVSYSVSVDATYIAITFADTKSVTSYYASTEEELKGVVRDVNKRLKNCRKPGKRRSVKCDG